MHIVLPLYFLYPFDRWIHNPYIFFFHNYLQLAEKHRKLEGEKQ